MADPMVIPDDEFERLSMFLPIKIVNGFVTCDFFLGCYCCKFCLNRRYPDWQHLLEKKKVYRNGLQVEHAAALLQRIKAFTDAKVTLKIGHDTDMSLEEAEAQQLYALLPADHPVAFMRRGKLLPEHRPFYLHDYPNLLVELTLTPRSDYLEYHADPFPVLESFAGVQCNMIYTVGPVCHDNVEEAKDILRVIPPGSKVWVRDLIVKDLPEYSRGPATSSGDQLREYALSHGHRLVPYLNCVVRAEVGLGFHKRGEFVTEKNVWQLKWAESCKVRELCACELPEEEERARIDAALHNLALTFAESPDKFGHKCYNVVVNEEVNFGDECYLRELTGLKVDLRKIGRKTGTFISRSIAARWKQQDLYPIDELFLMARESFQRVFAEE